MADGGHFPNAGVAVRRFFDGFDEGGEGLVNCQEAEALGAFAGGGDSLGDPIDGREEDGPTVAGAEDVPRAEDGDGQGGFAEEAFCFGADLLVNLHDGGGLGDA